MLPLLQVSLHRSIRTQRQLTVRLSEPVAAATSHASFWSFPFTFAFFSFGPNSPIFWLGRLWLNADRLKGCRPGSDNAPFSSRTRRACELACFAEDEGRDLVFVGGSSSSCPAGEKPFSTTVSLLFPFFFGVWRGFDSFDLRPLAVPSVSCLTPRPLVLATISSFDTCSIPPALAGVSVGGAEDDIAETKCAGVGSTPKRPINSSSELGPGSVGPLWTSCGSR